MTLTFAFPLSKGSCGLLQPGRLGSRMPGTAAVGLLVLLTILHGTVASASSNPLIHKSGPLCVNTIALVALKKV